MRVHLVGPFYGYIHSVNKGLLHAAESLGWGVEITDPLASMRNKSDWVGEIASSRSDFILCASISGWHGPFLGENSLPPRVLWLREECRKPIPVKYLEDTRGFYRKIFYFEPTGIDLLRDKGIQTEWLPLAFDPKVHRRFDLSKEIDVLFIGSLESKEGDLYPNRRFAIDLMSKAGIHLVVKSSWDPEENSKSYSKARIAWNLGAHIPELGPPENLKSIGYQNRVFEALGSGTLLFNHRVDRGRLLDHKKHLIEYDEYNLVEQLRYYLDHEEETSQISDEGNREARRSHTYKNRLLSIEKALRNDGIL